MQNRYPGYTPADFLGLVADHTITYQDCAELLEEELMLRFPCIRPDEFYPLIQEKSQDAEEYCHRLIKVHKQLEEMLRN